MGKFIFQQSQIQKHTARFSFSQKLEFDLQIPPLPMSSFPGKLGRLSENVNTLLYHSKYYYRFFSEYFWPLGKKKKKVRGWELGVNCPDTKRVLWLDPSCSSPLLNGSFLWISARWCKPKCNLWFTCCVSLKYSHFFLFYVFNRSLPL